MNKSTQTSQLQEHDNTRLFSQNIMQIFLSIMCICDAIQTGVTWNILKKENENNNHFCFKVL